MNKKILIAICVCLIVAIGIVAFFVASKPRWTEGVRFRWNLEDTPWHKGLYLRVSNWGNEPFNITRVEMVYLPNETIWLIWIEQYAGQYTVEPNYLKVFHWYGWYNESMDLPYVDIENSPERLAFFNLLEEGKDEKILEITVETTKATYTFYPQRYNKSTKPTSIEKKPEPEPEIYGLRVGWWCKNWTHNVTNVRYRLVYINVVNNYPEPVNVTRVELIYLPDETLGLIWIERFTLEPDGRNQLRADFSSYNDPSEERLEFFYLLLEGENKATIRIEAIVRIEVETEEAIYIYHPLGDATYVKPTSIEKK